MAHLAWRAACANRKRMRAGAGNIFAGRVLFEKFCYSRLAEIGSCGEIIREMRPDDWAALVLARGRAGALRIPVAKSPPSTAQPEIGRRYIARALVCAARRSSAAYHQGHSALTRN